ncbi:uncharacterized protein LOC128261107 [Drosophila gunungcola]|uniref:Uncharacterized protein n=1 Tax=Drosophila gunungcola TaxID=103775 RepID=A0A9Q0BKJ2_9MUSC|nr:uncharacterized protein LOC128261107 [Drosophila gunungcola]KAI8035015.1 hypothetical protein M5D96_012238 [Drosophila gunungcola]
MENYTLGGLLWDGALEIEPFEYEKGYQEDCSFLDVYVGFLWTFVAIYALSKLTQFSERYLGQRLLAHKHCGDVRSINSEWEQTLQIQEEFRCQLHDEVLHLTQKNLRLESMIEELRDCNLQLIGKNRMRSVPQEQQSSVQSNIYIRNSYIHLTRQVFVNDRQTDLNVRNVDGEDLSPMEASEEGLNVWMQYLKMRKSYIGSIADPNLMAASGPGHMEPIVMTTEQLANLQGIV